MRFKKLSNGIVIPRIMMGTSICDLKGKQRLLEKQLENAVIFGESFKCVGFDTARDYNNEYLLGDIFGRMFSNGFCKREDVFITTKVGNSQQRVRNMYNEIDISLHSLKLEYIDLWLLHWPLPDFWLDNWSQLVDIYKSGKVRAIGIANCRERHVELLRQSGLQMPHVVQVECHPFRSVQNFKRICLDNDIQLEAYSANCLMLPFVRENAILRNIATVHKKTITQIIMRWHLQRDVIPIFRSFNAEHIRENLDIYDFSLSDDEMQQITSLDIDYKFHPESLNCPGY